MGIIASRKDPFSQYRDCIQSKTKHDENARVPVDVCVRRTERRGWMRWMDRYKRLREFVVREKARRLIQSVRSTRDEFTVAIVETETSDERTQFWSLSNTYASITAGRATEKSFWLLRKEPSDTLLCEQRYQLVTELINKVCSLRLTIEDTHHTLTDAFEEEDDAIGDGIEFWVAYYMAHKASTNLQQLCDMLSKLEKIEVGDHKRVTTECPICLEPTPMKPYITICKHLFCSECWGKWSEHAPPPLTCPICRTPCSERDRELDTPSSIHYIDDDDSLSDDNNHSVENVAAITETASSAWSPPFRNSDNTSYRNVVNTFMC